MNDPIADFLIRIKNASLAGNKIVVAPYSSQKKSLAEILRRLGWLEKVEVIEDGAKKNLQLTLAKEKSPLEVKRISKPGRRVYLKAKDISKIRGLGTVIISTPAGLLVHKEAFKKKLGGEVVCKIG